MTTARTIINGALRHLGVTAAGEVPTASEANDALEALNNLLDAWSLESLLVISETLTTHTLVAGTETYTIGSGGDINITWPLQIDQAQLIVTQVTPNLDLNLRVLNEQEYGLIRIKSLNSTYPQAVWLHTTYPLATLHVWPVPSQGNQIRLWTRGAIASFATLDTDVNFGRGYVRALQYNLELELAHEHGRPIQLDLHRMAHQSKLVLKKGNTKPYISYADVPAGMGRDFGSYNWLSDRGAS